MDKALLKRIRLRLHKEDDHCFYCGVHTQLAKRRYAINPSNLATLDHIYSRKDIRRLIKKNDYNVVLCCLKCNAERAIRESCQLSWATSELLHPPIDIRSFIQNQKLSNESNSNA